MLPAIFQVNWPFGSEAKIHFQDGRHLGFPIGPILDQQVTPMLPTKFQVNWPFGSGAEAKNFQDGHHGSHHVFPIRMILAIFDLQVIPMLSTKFQVNWPWGVGVGF